MSDKPTPNVNPFPLFGFGGFTRGFESRCDIRIQWPHATLPPAGFLYTEEEALFHFWNLRQFDLAYVASSDDGTTPPDNINTVTGSITARPALYPADDLPRERVCLATGESASTTSLNDKYPGAGTGALVGVDGGGQLRGSALDRIFRGVPMVEFLDGTTSLGWGFAPANGISLGSITGNPLLYNFGTGAGSAVDIVLGVYGEESFPVLDIPDRIKYARLQLTSSTWLQVMVGERDQLGTADVVISGDGTSTLSFDVQLSGEGDNELTITASNAHIYTGPP